MSQYMMILALIAQCFCVHITHTMEDTSLRTNSTCEQNFNLIPFTTESNDKFLKVSIQEFYNDRNLGKVARATIQETTNQGKPVREDTVLIYNWHFDTNNTTVKGTYNLGSQTGQEVTTQFTIKDKNTIDKLSQHISVSNTNESVAEKITYPNEWMTKPKMIPQDKESVETSTSSQPNSPKAPAGRSWRKPFGVAVMIIIGWIVYSKYMKR